MKTWVFMGRFFQAAEAACSERRRTSSPLKDRQDKIFVKKITLESAAVKVPILFGQRFRSSVVGQTGERVLLNGKSRVASRLPGIRMELGDRK